METVAPIAGEREEDDDNDFDDAHSPATPYEQTALVILDKLPASVVIDINNLRTPKALAYYVSEQLFGFASNYFRLQDAQKALPDISIFTDFILDSLACFNALHPSDRMASTEFFALLETARQTIINDDTGRTEATCYA